MERRFSDEVEEGRVIESDPEGGDEVRQGSTVTIVVSKGQDLVEVPDVVGRRQAAAETAIRNASLVPNTVERDADEPEGEVVEAQPGTGSQVKRGSEVTLFVSTGEGSIKVADVVGRSRQRATDILHQQGLRVSFAEEPVDAPSRDGLVTQQTPSAGSRAKEGDRVTITIGRFQPPEEPGLEP